MRRIFWGFCINRFGIGPLNSRSDFSFEFSELFVIEKRLDKIAFKYNFLNISKVIEHYIPGFFFAKLIY